MTYLTLAAWRPDFRTLRVLRPCWAALTRFTDAAKSALRDT
ncbi:hypothetical protein AB8A21_18460 [Streptomyces sp. BF23-18]